MTRLIADWLWRLALLAALCWIGLELQHFHDDMLQPTDEPSTASAETDDVQDSLNAIRDDLDNLSLKVDALLVAMSRTK
jgi:hypothetical protein